MQALAKTLLALAAAAAATQAGAQLTAYEHRDFGGRSVTLDEPLDDFRRIEFNDRVSSIVVARHAWEVCDDAGFRGHCMILAPGYYPSLRDAGMNDRISSAREVRGEARHPPERYAPALPAPQVTLYDGPDFHGRAVTLLADAADFRAFSFNDRASSMVVLGQPWEACEDVNFGGRCVLLRPGRYPDLRAMGLGDRLSSVRVLAADIRIDDRRYGPPAAPAYDWRRRPQERLFDVPVVAVRAVYTTPQQRCWIERERVAAPDARPEVGGAVVGGLIGGILGHQVGGSGAATVGGAVVGAAIGANVAGREGNGMVVQNVQRCTAVPPQGRPDYWDVTYDFRGVQHHLQATAPPAATVTVNEHGEPRL